MPEKTNFGNWLFLCGWVIKSFQLNGQSTHLYIIDIFIYSTFRFIFNCSQGVKSFCRCNDYRAQFLLSAYQKKPVLKSLLLFSSRITRGVIVKKRYALVHKKKDSSYHCGCAHAQNVFSLIYWFCWCMYRDRRLHASHTDLNFHGQQKELWTKYMIIIKKLK